MRHIYYELNEIPVPDFGRPDGDRVYAWASMGGGEKKKIYIGWYAKKNVAVPTFYPSENFRLYYPVEWEKNYGSRLLPQHYVEIGIYTVMLALGHRTGIYPILHSSFGPMYGNAVMDYAMYSIKERRNAAYLFKPAMSNSFLFSLERKDDDWISDVFSNKITMNSIYDFRAKWIEQCRKRGIAEVWLAVDGSNSDYESENSRLSQKGAAKSKKNVDIVSYIWAVSAKDGTPVTFAVNEGGTVDCKAFNEICALLAGYGICVKGIILDRGFLTHKVVGQLREYGYDFIIKLKEDTYGETKMVSDYGKKIYWNMEYLAGKDGRFGIVSESPRKIFSTHNDEAYIAIYFDGKNGSERKVTLANKIDKAILDIEEDLRNGKKPAVDSSVKKYIEIREDALTPGAEGTNNEKLGGKDSEKKYRYVIKKENVDRDLWRKGFDGLACSFKTTARDANEIYHTRDASEKQFLISKSMLGNDAFRAHSDQGTQTRAMVCFVAAIIRCELMNACQRFSTKTGRVIEELDDKLFLALTSSGGYMLVNKLTEKQLEMLHIYGIDAKDLDTITGDINERIRKCGKGVSQFHDTPENVRKRYEEESFSKRTREPQSIESENKQLLENAPQINPKKRGRPPGRKNNKTLEREAAEKAMGKISEKKRGRGRPPGSKNKKTLEREAKEKEMGLEPLPKHPRGRPFGSKDSKPRFRRTKAEILESRKE